MAEQILVTKALDERDLLKKKIIRAIDDASFVATKRKKDDKCANGYTRGMSPVSLLDIEEFKQNATSQYQSINDMIKRFFNWLKSLFKRSAKEEVTEPKDYNLETEQHTIVQDNIDIVEWEVGDSLQEQSIA